MGWGTGRLLAVVGAVAVAGLGAGCSDDGPAEAVSAETYEQEVADLCLQHSEALSAAGDNFVETALSDAERIAYFRTDYIPRVRAIIEALDSQGLPEGRVEEYRAAFNDVLSTLQRFDAQVPQFIDDYRAGRLEPENNFPQLIAADLARTEIDCLE